ncbi:MAG: hypothetical protein IT368_15150 [Candidatus Hydrogenedentes bacterium]|nr:hypothetical protein [Candidatus Hydrogenedentota bacterium]
MRYDVGSWAAGIPVVYLAILGLVAIVHIAFATGVGNDAKRFHARGVSTFLVGPGMWAFATLIGGVWVAVAYWVIHHSNLRATAPPWERDRNAKPSAGTL